LWPAAESLANYLVINWSALQNCVVIELGAGCGLSGILASHLEGCMRVVLTDYDMGALDLLRENVDANNRKNCHIEFLEWGQIIPSPILSIMDSALPITIIGSDLLYCADIVMPLFQTVYEMLQYGRSGIFVLVSSFDTGKVRLAHQHTISFNIYILFNKITYILY
jgi:predicted nicotinamide N-methyase